MSSERRAKQLRRAKRLVDALLVARVDYLMAQGLPVQEASKQGVAEVRALSLDAMEAIAQAAKTPTSARRAADAMAGTAQW